MDGCPWSLGLPCARSDGVKVLNWQASQTQVCTIGVSVGESGAAQDMNIKVKTGLGKSPETFKGTSGFMLSEGFGWGSRTREEVFGRFSTA